VPRWDLVIFDCDGVLVDSEPIANRVFTDLLNEIGLRTTLAETMRDYVGRSMASCMAIVTERLGRPVPDDFVDAFRDRTADAFRAELRAVPGIEAALDAVREPTCVASSGEHRKIRLSLGLTGLLPRFEGRIFSAQDVPRGKPHPDLFLHAARTLGADPARCAVVEDSPLGVQAGVAAGMTVFGFAARTEAAALAALGAATFDDMTRLPDLLRGAPTG
jgi:HAD superfamily hydrolase (TIGR01509 family)